MVSILINWLYTGIFVFLTGMAGMQGYLVLMKKIDKGSFHREFGIGHVLFTGILGTTLYAQIFSLFYKVSLEANLFLMGLLFFYLLTQRKFVFATCKGWKSGVQKDKTICILLLILAAAVFAFALCAAGPAKQIDTDWYHAQTIRWIEEYGCVKGVANLFYALGFNNAQHYFDALFSMKWLWGQSLRGSGGFFGLVIFLHGLIRFMQWKKHKGHVADVLALWEMVYSIIITAFYTDPYVDTLPNILVMFILTEWLAMLEEGKKETVWLGYYCLLAVFAVVCKTSVATIVFLTVYAVYELIRQKKAGQILLFLGIGFLIALPYLITNVITTGYLVYLLSALDLFKVKWKIDPKILQYSVDNMVAFARMPSKPMEEALHCGLAWVTDWWQRESISHKLLYMGIVCMVVGDIFMTVLAWCKNKALDVAMLWPRICVYAGLVYWFFTIPQVKYCWAFLIFPLAVVPVYYFEKNKKNRFVRGLLGISVGLLVLYAGFYGLRTAGYMENGIRNYLLRQADYENHVFNTITLNGHTFYTRIDNGDIVCGYYIFPYLDNKEDAERLVVPDNLGEGFYFEN